MTEGYYRYPTIFGDRVVFVSEDDLWSVATTGGKATRLTSGRGIFTRPRFSPDGKVLAFSSSEEDAMEVFTMSSHGGEIKRLIYFGMISNVVGWTPQGEVIFSSSALNPQRVTTLYTVDPKHPHPKAMGFGPATSLALSAKGAVVIERGSNRPDPAHWKRYRGGTAGQLWTATALTGEFKNILPELKGNLAAPLWLNNRIYFLSDHSGFGNICSCKVDGGDLKIHTKFSDFYARNISSDGKKIVFHAGADIFVYDPRADRSAKIEIESHSQRPQRQRKLVPASDNFESCHLSQDGTRTAYTTRGQVFNFGNWQGPVYRNGLEEAVRFRLGSWLKDNRLIAVSDSKGQDQIEVFHQNQAEPIKVIKKDFGRIIEIKVAPTRDLVALTNHRNELFVLDIEKETLSLVARDELAFIHLQGLAWSADGRYLAFCQSVTRTSNQVQIVEIDGMKVRAVTRPGLRYTQPNFDPHGRYLYFLSHEKLNPVYSDLVFDISFPRTAIPALVTLQKDIPSPFVASALSVKANSEKKVGGKAKEPAPLEVRIDWTNIETRMQSFPVTEAKFVGVQSSLDNLFFVSEPVKGTAKRNWLSKVQPAENSVQSYNFKTNRLEDFLSGVTDFQVNDSRTHFIARMGQQIRIGKTTENKWGKDDKSEFSEESGWIDTSRVRVIIDPVLEWQQMFSEVWRLQRDFFWVENMSGIDWVKVYKQYRPLISRIASRTEFSDLVWEMQGELGTSHAYDIGGDLKPSPAMSLGRLGADLEFDAKAKAFRVQRIYDGGVNEFKEMSPLRQPGLNIKRGDEIVAVDGVDVDEDRSPQSLLIGRANKEVEISVQHKGGKRKDYTIFALADDKNLRYRQWVEDNRTYVHQKSNGRVGYVHIPDMSPDGYAEFFRSYVMEYDKEGLIIDVRFNGGGHVSQLVLEYLQRKRIGVAQSRWQGLHPYPEDSPRGPMVALTNQYAGSDGDIFSHAFKMLKLGPLIGTRTWGGVIGIHPRNFLADGGVTTQPEFSFWFSDVGWGVENYGTDPDVKVDIAPHHYHRGEDPQLDRGLQEVMKVMTEKPGFDPKLKDYPNLWFKRKLQSER